MKLSLIVPLYKGESFITSDIQTKYKAVQKFLPAEDFELIYVIDGHVDCAYEIARQYINKAKLDNVRIYLRENNKGKGYSVVEGMYRARGKYIAYTDAGFDIDLSALEKMYRKISADKELTVIIANKYHQESEYKTNLFRRVLSYGYINLVNLLFWMRLPDLQTGMKMFRGSAVRKVLPKLMVKKFAFEIELLTALKVNDLARVADVPAKLNIVTKSTINFSRDVVNVFKDTLAVFYRAYILKWYSDSKAPWQLMFFPGRTIVSEIGRK